MPLFDRSSSGMSLTSAGELYLAYARSVLFDLDRLHSQIDDLKGLRRGRVRIGTIEGVGLRHSHTGHRRVQGSISGRDVPSPDDGLRHDFRTHSRRAMWTSGSPTMRSLISTFVFAFRISDPLQAIVHRNHPIGRLRQVGLAEALAYPVAVPEEYFGIRRPARPELSSGASEIEACPGHELDRGAEGVRSNERRSDHAAGALDTRRLGARGDGGRRALPGKPPSFERLGRFDRLRCRGPEPPTGRRTHDAFLSLPFPERFAAPYASVGGRAARSEPSLGRRCHEDCKHRDEDGETFGWSRRSPPGGRGLLVDLTRAYADLMDDREERASASRLAAARVPLEHAAVPGRRASDARRRARGRRSRDPRLERGRRGRALAGPRHGSRGGDRDLPRTRSPAGQDHLDRRELPKNTSTSSPTIAAARGLEPIAAKLSGAAYPPAFAKLPSTVTGHEHPVRYPRWTTQLDYEAELCVVIGRRCPKRVGLGSAGCRRRLHDHQRRLHARHPARGDEPGHASPR